MARGWYKAKRKDRTQEYLTLVSMMTTSAGTSCVGCGEVDAGCSRAPSLCGTAHGHCLLLPALQSAEFFWESYCCKQACTPHTWLCAGGFKEGET